MLSRGRRFCRTRFSLELSEGKGAAEASKSHASILHLSCLAQVQAACSWACSCGQVQWRLERNRAKQAIIHFCNVFLRDSRAWRWHSTSEFRNLDTAYSSPKPSKTTSHNLVRGQAYADAQKTQRYRGYNFPVPGLTQSRWVTSSCRTSSSHMFSHTV